MVFAAKGTILGRIAHLNHKVNEVLDREDRVVEDGVLRVNCLYERPILANQLNVVRVHPKVRRVHEIEEEFFAQLCVIDEKSELGQQLNGLAIDWRDLRIIHG